MASAGIIIVNSTREPIAGKTSITNKTPPAETFSVMAFCSPSSVSITNSKRSGKRTALRTGSVAGTACGLPTLALGTVATSVFQPEKGYLSHLSELEYRTACSFLVKKNHFHSPTPVMVAPYWKSPARVQKKKTLSPYTILMRLTPKFLLSAFDEAHFPTAAATGGAPEVAFLGRSNVGKSSLINALAPGAQARVSSTPGRTRSINFFCMYEGAKTKPELVLADLPGYGYAKISKSISAEWGGFIDPYLGGREQLKLCICLVDTNIPPQPSDTQLQEYLRQVGRPFLVVGTKSDKLSNNTLSKSIAALKKAHGVDEIFACSSKDAKTVAALWSRILTAVSS